MKEEMENKEDKKIFKVFSSPTYNYIFQKTTGLFLRWGATEEEDPNFCPYGPDILDIEISSGYCNGNCPWCYKANDSSLPVKYMTLDTYKKLFEKFNLKVLTQVALGITTIDANPEFWDIVKFTRSKGIICNYTTNGIGVTEEIAKLTKQYCGAVAVSCYPHSKDIAYEAIRKYHEAGIEQVNMHFMLSQETYDFALEVLEDTFTSKLLGLNAIVFLQYKDKNPKSRFNTCTYEQSKKLINYCLDQRIPFGFDSCSSSVFMKAVYNRPERDSLIQMVDNCESSLFSFYSNVDGVAYPCSFLEGIGEWKEGINLLDYQGDFWYDERVKKYREKLINSSSSCICDLVGKCRSCMEYKINTCQGSV